jgi:hypothetical protein
VFDAVFRSICESNGCGTYGMCRMCPPPTGNIDLDEAFPMLPQRIALIGGIEPVFFKDCTVEQLKERVRELLHIAGGRRYVLANSDSCPPGVSLEKFYAVAPLLR